VENRNKLKSTKKKTADERGRKCPVVDKMAVVAGQDRACLDDNVSLMLRPPNGETELSPLGHFSLLEHGVYF